jgi:beta-galactosidase
LGWLPDVSPAESLSKNSPAPWLKVGKNEVVVLDLIGPRAPALAGLSQPILGELHPELDFAR